MTDFVTIKIPSSLKEEIQYYRKKNESKGTFNKFVIDELEDALQNQILKSVSGLDNAFRCKDSEPKTKRHTFTVMEKTHEYFICEKCAKLPIFQNMDSEETVVWGDFKT